MGVIDINFLNLNKTKLRISGFEAAVNDDNGND
jgi:hypothetical protein